MQSARTEKVCDLRRISQLLIDRGRTHPDQPIATVRIANYASDRPTYLVLMSGVDHLLNWDAHTANIPPEAVRDWGGLPSMYVLALLDVVRTLPPGPAGKRPRLILAGFSHGGMAIQNAVALLNGRGYPVDEAISIGAPITAFREGNTRYLQVMAANDWVAESKPFLGAIEGVIKIPGDPDPVKAHFTYETSEALAQTDLLGDRVTAQSPCFILDETTYRTYPAPGLTSRLMQLVAGENPCQQLRYRDPPSEQQYFDRNAKMGWHGQFAAAQTDYARNQVAEGIGEAGMDFEATRRGYKLMWKPQTRGYGLDAVYQAPDGTYVIAEAKGGYAMPQGANPVDFLEQQVLGQAYGCLQGTVGWAAAALKTVTRSRGASGPSKPDADVRMAQSLLNRFASGVPVRIEVFWTEHENGWPGVTRHFLTDSNP